MATTDSRLAPVRVGLDATTTTTTTTTDDGKDKKVRIPTSMLSFIPIPKEMEKFALAGSAIAVAIFCAAPMKTIGSVWHVFMTSMGMAVGVGVGLGLAMHVYEQLQEMQKAHDEQKKPYKKKRLSVENIRPKSSSASRQSSNVLEDGTSYVSLMASAGYSIEDKVLRGQVLKDDDSFWETKYRFTDVTVDKQHGPRLLHEDWPSLPEPVTRELGRFVEHVMRDYISGWYSRLDVGCIYLDERQRRQDGIPRDGGQQPSKHVHVPVPAPVPVPVHVPPNESESESDPESKPEIKASDTSIRVPVPNKTNDCVEEETDNNQARKDKTVRHSRNMVFSTKTHRQIPMLDQTYKTLSAAFGNLATRAEHVNIFSLVLLKWTQVLAHTFKVYRTLRKIAQEKNGMDSPTEIQVTREFLLAGKLHRAVTFGLDVPSLLFADATGQECGTGTDKPALDPDQVLEQRLFGTKILTECELDYNRVVAHRLVRALIPRSDSGSHVVLALVVEIFGACVLQPLMNLWIPSFLNNLIKKATESKNKNTNTGAETNDSATPSSLQNNTDLDKATDDSTSETQRMGKGIEATRNADNSIGTEGMIQPDQSNKLVLTTGATADSSNPHTPKLTKETSAISIDSPGGEFLNDAVVPELEPINSFPHETSFTAGQVILKLTSLALEDLQKFMDFDQCRLARAKNMENGVDWDDPSCQEAVLKLVMVVEAGILHGRSKPPESSKNVNENDGESTLPAVESRSMSQILMEMTSNMDVFEKSIAQIMEGPALKRTPDYGTVDDYEPDAGEISTLRTLISTWLHTGQGFRAISLLVQGNQAILAPFYDSQAFLQNQRYADRFLEALQVLDELDIMVETMAALAMPRVDLEAESSLLLTAASETTERGSATIHQKEYRRVSATSLLRSGTPGRHLDEQMSGSNHDPMTLFPTISNPRYLDFHRNAAFASSLRSERERRNRSWASLKADENLQTICRKSALPSDIELHRELHNLSRMFYNGTNVMTIRDAARKSETTGQPQTKADGEQDKVSLLTVEMVSNRRRIEVPDDDSSFLLRAQVSALESLFDKSCYMFLSAR
jgi:hypothetical protein